MRNRMLVALAVMFSMMFLVACGAPTVESQTRYFQQNIDQMDALAAKNPQLKPTFDVKKAEFMAEFAQLKNGVGEEGARALQTLNSRVSRFMNEFAPQPAPGTTQPGNKLGTTAPGQPMPVGGQMGGQPAVGGQMGVQPAVGGQMGVQPAVGGKMGGTAPVGQPMPVGGAVQPGGSGFGGTPGGAVPVQPVGQPVQPVGQPVPVQPQGGSGFGGQ